MNDKQLEQLSERVREAKGAVDEGDSKRGMTLMRRLRARLRGARPAGHP